MSLSRIILASQSPSRKELLERLGLPFIVAPQNIDETPYDKERPHPYVRRLAKEKAHKAQKDNPNAVIIAADTIIYKGHTILQKPKDAEEARTMIEQLSGARHRVFTGLCVLHNKKKCVKSIVTRVQFRRLQPKAIKQHVLSQNWKGCSGGYNLASASLAFIKNVNGSISSIIGLPLAELCSILSTFGIDHDF